MADVSAIKPAGAGGASYNFKDAAARVNINILFGQDEELDTRVTALENAPSGGGPAFWVTDEIEDPGDWDISDCDYLFILERSFWDYDDNDQPKLYTSYPVYTYYNGVQDNNVRVGEAKAGDIIVIENYDRRTFYGSLPSTETIGHLSESNLDGRYVQKSPPDPAPPGGFPITGSGSSINLGQTVDTSKSFYYVAGLTTVTRASEDFPGKTNTYKLAKCFKMI